MKTVPIQTASKTYSVYAGSGALNELSSFIKEAFPSLTKIMIITDETVANLYLHDLQAALADFEAASCIVPNGEHAKTFDVYYQALTFALEQKLDRKSLLIAFGGGAVGDLGGFVAASYMRGIPFIQVPTTILAHDSAVGGKVAINHPLGKNMIGAFHQPEAVFYDLRFLDSLPMREKRSGFAEVIKHSLIGDETFYSRLLKEIQSLDKIADDELSFMLLKGIEIKGSIVAVDEKETGIRAFLNFGHTLGHAIEAEMGYGKWTHGESIAVGMLFALELSIKKAGLSFNIEPFKAWLSKLGYETQIPKGLDHLKLLERMKQDKKSVGQRISFVLLEEIGQPAIYEISDTELMTELERFQ